MNGSNNNEVVVLGAGAIGAYSALELIKSGKRVTLIDRRNPGSETSMGNAGVLNRGSIIPFNNPELTKILHKLLTKQHVGFDYNFRYLFNEIGWASRFLSHCTTENTLKRATALNNLIVRSSEIYKTTLTEKYLRQGGWLKLFRDKVPSRDSFEIRALKENNVQFDILNSNEISDLEPSLKGFHNEALLINDTMSLKNPQQAIQEITRQFQERGGIFTKSEVQSLSREDAQWNIQLSQNENIASKNVIVALGPWSRVFLEKFNLYLPMVYERGAHREFERGAISLNRPIHDTFGGYVLSPLSDRWRITSGVELAPIDAYRSPNQLNAACTAMKKVITPGDQIDKPDWLGYRPTLPDSLPAIGKTKIPNLWLATGHQHIGMATAPASGELISDLINNRKPRFEEKPFCPSRFNI